MSGKPNVTVRKLTDYKPNPRNHNKGSERGSGMIEYSFRTFGAGRSLLADKNGVLIAGNQSQEGALNAGIERVIEVETTGNDIVVVKRTDLDLEQDERAVLLSYADNRTHEVSFELDIEQVEADVERGIDLSGLWTEAELAQMKPATADEWENALGNLADGDRAPFQQMTFTLHDEQAEQVKRAIAAALQQGAFTDSLNENRNGNALARICETYLTTVDYDG